LFFRHSLPRTVPLSASTIKITTGIEIMSTETLPESPSPVGNSPAGSPLDPSDHAQPPPARKGSWVRILVYLALAGGLGFVVWRIHQNQQLSAQMSADQEAALASQPIPVQVSAAERKPMPIFLTALGTVTPYMTVTVKARVSGELEPVKFTEGQQVRAGQTIMIIDPKPYQAALDQAKGNLVHDEALLKNAQAEYARYKSLFDAGVTSKETLDADEAAQGQYQGAIAADKAAIETAQLQLDWCSIQSPIDGRIGLRLVDPGNIITANSTNLVIINQFQPIAVYFTLPENELPQVLHKLAADKRLLVDAYDRSDQVKLASGYLLTGDNQIDTTTGTEKLKAVFSNGDQSLFPNQFVNIHLVLENRPSALVIPSASIQSGIDGSFVWVIDTKNAAANAGGNSTGAGGSGTARVQPVKIALSEGMFTILDGGLQPGQNVVVDGADRLRAGQSVIATAALKLPAPASAVAPQPAATGALQPNPGASQAPAGSAK
jgi:multidrug efflux system membrane fusion protein